MTLLCLIRNTLRKDSASCQLVSSVPAPVDCWLIAMVAGASVVVVPVVAGSWEGSVIADLYIGRYNRRERLF